MKPLLASALSRRPLLYSVNEHELKTWFENRSPSLIIVVILGSTPLVPSSALSLPDRAIEQMSFSCATSLVLRMASLHLETYYYESAAHSGK